MKKLLSTIVLAIVQLPGGHKLEYGITLLQAIPMYHLLK
jgi:hypothetical protein